MKEKLTVVYSNKLNNYNLSFLGVQMKRMLMMCLALVHKQPEVPVYFDRTILGMITGSHLSETEARELLQNFYEKVFDLTLESVRDKYAEKIHIFRSVVYNSEDIEMELKIDRDALTYVGELVDDFTAFQIEEFCQIQSPLGQELYRQMKQWKRKGQTPQIDIEEMKVFAGMSPKIKIDKFKDRIESNLTIFEEKGMFKHIQCCYIKEKGSKKYTSIEIKFDPQNKKDSSEILTEEERLSLTKKYGEVLVDRQLQRIKEHPEWKGIDYDTIDKWCMEKKNAHKEKGNFCKIEKQDYDFELLEKMLTKKIKTTNPEE